MTSPVRPLPKTPMPRNPLVAPKRAGTPLRDPLAPNSYAAAIPPRADAVATPAIANPQDQLRSQMAATMAARVNGAPAPAPPSARLQDPAQRPAFSTYSTPMQSELMNNARAPIANQDDAMRARMVEMMQRQSELARGGSEMTELFYGAGLYGSNPELQQAAQQPGYMREDFPGQGNAYGRGRRRSRRSER